MLDIKNQPIDRLLFYAVGFTVFDACQDDIYDINPFSLFIKEVTGESPAMRVLMQKMIEQKYVVEVNR